MAFTVPSAFYPPGNFCFTVPYANPYTEAEFVNPSPLIPPIGPITGISVTNITTTGFTVTLNSVQNATNYHFQWGTYSITSPNTTGILINLPPDTTNNLVIIAYNEDGSITSLPTPVSTLTPPPVAPAGLTATNVLTTSFDLDWMPSSYATSYTAVWGSTPATSIVGTTASFTGLPPATTNSCIVTATNSAGSAQSAPYPVLTALPIPAAPQNVDSYNINVSGFEASWIASQYASSYTATWTSAGPTVYNGTVNGTVATFSLLPNNTLGDCVITAINPSGSASSTPLPVQTTSLPPAAPTGLMTTRTGGQYFNATWTNDPSVNEYYVTVNSSTTGVTVVGNTATVTGLDYFTYYTISVVAHNTYGSSPPTNLIVQTTQTAIWTLVDAGTPIPISPNVGFGYETLGSWAVPADFDDQANSLIYTDPNTIEFVKWWVYNPQPSPGAFMAFRMSKTGNVNEFDQEWAGYFPDPNTGVEYAIPPNAPNWNGSTNWTFKSGDTLTLFFLIPYPAWEVLFGQVDSLYTKYDTFTIP